MTEGRFPWLRRPRPGGGIDWGFIGYWTLVGTFIGLGTMTLLVHLLSYGPRPGDLFGDVRLYYQATKTWLVGGDPWTVKSAEGVQFAGPPPALLLNLPLLPFGPEFARIFWGIADLVGWIAVIRRLRLGPWWILFPPFVEGYFPGSPDPALAGLVVLGGGWLAAVSKWYSIPAIAAEGRWRSIAIAVLIGLGSLFVLPWATFVNDLPMISATLDQQSRHVSAWGDPVVMTLVTVALISLGPRMALRLVVPALWPGAQLHYSVFSAKAGAESAALAVALAMPGFTAQLILAYAVVVAVSRVVSARVPAVRAGRP